MRIRRLATSFEGLDSFLTQLPGELWRYKVAWKYRLNMGFGIMNISYTGTEGIKMLRFLMWIILIFKVYWNAIKQTKIQSFNDYIFITFAINSKTI